MVKCNECRFNDNDIICTACKCGEVFERKTLSESKKIVKHKDRNYCPHCGYWLTYDQYKGLLKCYCCRCGGHITLF